MNNVNVHKYVDAEGFYHFTISESKADVMPCGRSEQALLPEKNTGFDPCKEDLYQINQGIYEEALLTNTAHRLQGGKESQILELIYNLYKANMHVPPQFLSELQMAVIWAKRLENLDTLAVAQKEIKAQELFGDISNSIKNLNPGDGCIIPGGTHLIFRILKSDNHAYTLMPFSRNSHFKAFESISLGGREKVRRVTFEPLSLEEITDATFIQKLVMLSKCGQNAVLEANSFFELFKSKISLLKTGPFHVTHTSLCRIQNIWDLLREGYGAKPSGLNLGRHKFDLQFKVFQDYFKSAKEGLSKDSPAFYYLVEGIKSLARKGLYFYSKGYLQENEMSSIYNELINIKNILNQVEKAHFKGHLDDSIPTSRLIFKINAQPLHLPKIAVIKEGQALVTSKKSSASTPYFYMDKQYVLKPKVTVEMSPVSCHSQFEDLLAYLKNTHLSILQREQYAVDFILALPLNPQNDNDLWKGLSLEDRLKISQKLSDLSANLFNFMNLSGSNAPNRILAVVKIAIISEHLARLNGEWTHFEKYMFCAELFFLFTDVLRGSGGYCNDGKRSLLGHSVYPIYIKSEEAVLLQIKGYYEWLNEQCSLFSGYIKDLDLENEISWDRQNDAEGALHGSSTWFEGKRLERHDIEIDLSKKPFKNNVQCQLLHNLLKKLRLEVKANEKLPSNLIESLMRYGVSLPVPISLAGTYSRWGKSIKNSLLSAIFYAFSPEKGRLKSMPFTEPDYNTFTQEAVMDDPWIAIQRAYACWQKDLPSAHPLKKKSFQQAAYSAKPEILTYFSDNDLRDFLLALEPVSGIWNLLGLIKKKPALLKFKDFQIIVEKMILQPRLLEISLKIDPKLPEFLGSFFESHIQQFERINELPLALFMVQMYYAMINKIPAEKKPPNLPDFKPNLRRWMTDALKPASQWVMHRYALISELFVQIGAQAKLNHSEIKEFAILKGLWQESASLKDFDSIQADLIHKHYFQWMPQIEQALKDSPDQNLLLHIIEELASARSLPISKALKWEGRFPVYRTSEWEFDLTIGTFKNLQNIPSPVSLPPHMLNNSLFQEAFPDFSPEAIHCYSCHQQGITYYHFRDAYQIVNLLETTAEGLRIFKSNPLDPSQWVQYISIEKQSLNQLGSLGSSHRLYVSLYNPSEAFVFNIQGQPEFQLHLNNSLASNATEAAVHSIFNINPKRGPIRRLQGTLMDPQLHAGLKPLLQLSNPSDILIWTEDNQLAKIEFYGLGLVFNYANHELVCETDPLKGYKIDLSALPRFDLPAGMTLLPANNTQNLPKWIVPFFSGKFELKKPENTSSNISKATKYLWNTAWSSLGYEAKQAESASIDRLNWTFQPVSSKGFWTFSIKLEGNSLDLSETGQGYNSWFDLFKYSICASQAGLEQAVIGAKEALKHLSEMAQNKIPERDLEVFAFEITKLGSRNFKTFSKPHPEAIAIALQGLLAIKDKGSPALCHKIEQLICKMVPIYYKRGRQIQIKALLDEKQELTCLVMMKSYEPKWFEKNALLLSYNKEPSLSIALKDNRVNESDKSSANPFNSVSEAFMHTPKLPLECHTLETGLEGMLKAQPEISKEPLAISRQKGDALFSQEDLSTYFHPTTLTSSFESLALSNLLDSEEPSVRRMANKVLAEIETMTDSAPSLKFLFRNKQAALSLSNKLQTTLNSLTQFHQVSKQSIEELLKPPVSLLSNMKALAGYSTAVSWEELIMALLQQELDTLQSRLSKGVDIQKLKNLLVDHLKLDIFIKMIKRTQDELKEIHEEPLLINSPSAGSKIYELLSRERCYCPAKYPELLAMEYLFGFMVREDQLQMIIDFINNPCCVQQAPTGAGKTNVILPLVALMKGDGRNLVSVKFLDPLFYESYEHLQKLLGMSLNKKIFPLLFSGDTPLTCERYVKGKKEKQSLFKYFYEESIKTILNKGCLITNKRSQPLLKAKMIEIYDRLSQMPVNDHPKIDLEHLYYLGKLLCLFKEREETLYDEFDKFLSAREELHFRIGQGKPLASFVSETLLNIYDALIQNSLLNLSDNTQAELTKADQLKIIDQTADALNAVWLDKGVDAKKYLLGKLSADEEIEFFGKIENPQSKAPFSLEDLDRISLQKDLLIGFLPTTLFKAADQRYIRSKLDQKSIIPCDYADMPKEGSEFEDIRVKLCYLIQYYYQKGPSLVFFMQWIHGLKNQALESLITGEVSHINQTLAEKVFKDYFTEASLDAISEETIKNLYKTLKGDKFLIRKFLNVLVQEQKLPGKKVSLNPHNQVSIAKASSGTSATKGSVEGLHRSFRVKETDPQANAKMILRFLHRLDPNEPFLTFDQRLPKRIITELLKQDKKLKVIIDGAGALRGMPFHKPAKQLLENQTELKNAGYFDQNGRKHRVNHTSSEGKEDGLIYSNSQARGADAALSIHHKAVLLVNGRSSQEELCQNEGRLRKEDQKLRIAVPKSSQIQSVGDLINATISTEALERSLDLFISKQQEIQDILHDEMTTLLASYAANQDFSSGFKAYAAFAPAQILASEFSENWDEPGSYYKLHKHIKRTKDPVYALILIKDKYLKMAEEYNFVQSKRLLSHLDFELFRPLLPLEVYGDMKANQEVQIETERQSEAHTEIETETEIDTDVEKPLLSFYLPWDWQPDYSTYNFNRYQPAYSGVGHTPNFMPLSRNRNAPQAHQRQIHDLRQNRLVHIEFGGVFVSAVALDVKDVTKHCFEILGKASYSKDSILYDTRLNRFIHANEPEIKELEDQAAEAALYDPKNSSRTNMFVKSGKKNLYIAQLRFEDGQFNGYTEGEWKALTWWLRQQQHPEELENYFIQEVLKNRPQDRERYYHSPLQALFEQIKPH